MHGGAYRLVVIGGFKMYFDGGRLRLDSRKVFPLGEGVPLVSLNASSDLYSCVDTGMTFDTSAIVDEDGLGNLSYQWKVDEGITAWGDSSFSNYGHHSQLATDFGQKLDRLWLDLEL